MISYRRDIDLSGRELLSCPPTRAWELGLGALRAMGALPQSAHRPLREWVAGAGVAVILYGIVAFDSETQFPGLAALAPCLGAAAVIWAGGQGPTLVGRLLSSPPAVGIGLISYSLYLWHWPPLVIARGFEPGGELTLPAAAAAIGCATVLAYLSWRFVERPFRVPPHRGGYSRTQIFAWSGVGALGLVALAATALVTNGYHHRMDPADMIVYGDAIKRPDVNTACHKGDPGRGLCVLGEGGDGLGHGDATRATSIVWGDSHAGAIVPGFDHWFDAQGLTAVAAIKNACAPLLGLVRLDQPPSHDCAGRNDAVLA